jgi:catechol-2,3-dioxygenase
VADPSHLEAHAGNDAGAGAAPRRGILHHVELQSLDLRSTTPAFDWLLGELGYAPFQEWPGGRSWRLGATYLVLAAAPGATPHDRRAAGLSHLAFHAGTRGDVDRLWEAAPEHGWRRLYADRHPYAGGGDHYAAFLENAERFKVELVAG